jgi:hypothetical protein
MIEFMKTTKNSCWMEESRSTWILSGPVCLSMLTNAFFLVNIVRVLVTKLRAPSSASYNTAHHQRESNEMHRADANVNEEPHRPDEIGDRVNGHVPVSGIVSSAGGVGPAGVAHRSGTNTSLSGLRKAVR